MRRLFLFAVSFLAFVSSLLAAETDSVCYGKCLDEFVLVDEASKYQTGSKFEIISQKDVDLISETNLDNIITRTAPIYIKGNAGGLTTIRFRGTSANHTSILFGGLNVNSLTLGHSNMSSYSMYMFDNLQIQYGNSSAVNGSGAVGGAIRLGLSNNWTNGIKVNLKTVQGSFGEQLYGTKVFIGDGKFEFVTRAFYYKKENDFPFKNPYNTEMGNVIVDDVQMGAAIENMGAIQEFNYRFSANEFIKSAFWFEHDWHQIQPNMSENYAKEEVKELENSHSRIWTEYQNDNHEIRFNIGAGFVSDEQIPYRDLDQTIATKRFVSQVEAKQDVKQFFSYKVGAKYKYIKPDVYAYNDSAISYEEHVETYLMSYFNIVKRLRLTINLRQQFVTNFDAPFTPAVGLNYVLLDKLKSYWNFTANASRSYRVPTFNDRYWTIDGKGNPNLKAENGLHYEVGSRFSFTNKKLKTETTVNAYYMDVKDWIEWVNLMATNKDEVISKGFEVTNREEFKLNKSVELNLHGNYSFNIATIEEGTYVGQELAYSPKHVFNAGVGAAYNSYELYFDVHYTGDRYADYSQPDRVELNGYRLFNAGIQKKFLWKEHDFAVNLSCKNITDKWFQNEYKYAMPGRSFNLSINTNFNIKN